jgi:CBS domain-containing protein
MQRASRGMRVQVFFGETDQVGHTPRYQAILEYLRKEGAAGATVVRGVAGFGANSKIHTAAILRLSLDLPMILTWIDAPGRVERLLPGLRDLAGSGIVTVEAVEIAAYGGRRLEQLRFDLPVQDVMTRPGLSILADSPARAAAELLVGREFRALPVLNGEGRVVGVVSSGDLVERGGLGARLELLSAMSETARRGFLDQISARTVRDVMTPEPAMVRTTDTVATATHLMTERRIKRVPVVDQDGRLAGILARSDVLRAVGETFPRDLAAAAEHPGAQTVGELMRAEVPIVREDADLAALLDAVVSTRLNRAVVVDAADRVLGIVSDAEVLRSVDPAASAGVVGALMRTAGRPAAGNLRARELVGRAPLTAGPETPIADAARLMTETRFKVLCVVDGDGRLLGIVDRADLLHAAGDALRELASASRAGDDDDD